MTKAMRTSARTAIAASAAVVLLASSYFGWSALRNRNSSAEERLGCCFLNTTSASGMPLDPMLFKGPVRDAYRNARENPALFSQLHCYCGCDKEFGHRSLLDCFRDTHGSRCEICVGEAIEATRLAAQGVPVDRIRDALRSRFSRET